MNSKELVNPKNHLSISTKKWNQILNDELLKNNDELCITAQDFQKGIEYFSKIQFDGNNLIYHHSGGAAWYEVEMTQDEKNKFLSIIK